MIAGNYTDGSDTLTISSDGAIFEQDATTGCVVNGQVSIPNMSYNAYSFSVTYANCTGANSVLNGTTATGLSLTTIRSHQTSWMPVGTGPLMARCTFLLEFFPNSEVTNLNARIGQLHSGPHHNLTHGR